MKTIIRLTTAFVFALLLATCSNMLTELPPNADSKATVADKAALELVLSGPDTLALVTGSFALPCVGTSGSVITWASDNAAVLSADGTVARPAIGADNASVTLTATITKGGVTVTKRFTVTVAATSSDPTTAVAEDKASLVDAALKGNNADLSHVTSALSLPTTGPSGTTISWTSDNAAISSTGVVTQPVVGAANETVTLTATITLAGGTTVTKSFTVVVLPVSGSGGAGALTTSALIFADGATVTKAMGSGAYSNSVSGVGSGTITYSSGTTATATVDATTGAITLVAAGTTVITASKAATSTHSAVTNTYTLTVTLIASTLVFADGATVAKTMGSGAYTNAVSGVGGGTITYSSGTTATATVDASTGAITLVAGGTTVITASKAATGTHSAVTNTYTLTVVRVYAVNATGPAGGKVLHQSERNDRRLDLPRGVDRRSPYYFSLEDSWHLNNWHGHGHWYR
ncbi:MAG: immunoglobulin-like domain-containing protein [Spirochaetales bacterium]